MNQYKTKSDQRSQTSKETTLLPGKHNTVSVVYWQSYPSDYGADMV